MVHCIAGVSRSASLCMAYLMRYQQMSLASAFEHVKICRPVVRPNKGFLRQLVQWETELNNNNHDYSLTRRSNGGRGSTFKEFDVADETLSFVRAL